MSELSPNLNDLAWGAFMYWMSSYGGNIGGDQAYIELFKAHDFLEELRYSPNTVTHASIQEQFGAYHTDLIDEPGSSTGPLWNILSGTTPKGCTVLLAKGRVNSYKNVTEGK